MKLTRQQAIKNHKEMWNWIADYYAKYDGKVMRDNINFYPENSLEIEHLKSKYFKIHNIKPISGFCFCCEYKEQKNIQCSNCPLDWTSDSSQNCCTNSNKTGLYDSIRIASRKTLINTKLCEKLARKIANLEERKD